MTIRPNRRPDRRSGLARWTAVASTLTLAGLASAQEVVREGTGPRRDALDAMELRPFPAELWGELSEWSTGEPLTASDLDGKVVLVCTWSGWYPGALRVLPTVQGLASEHEADGLVVVGVHNPRGFERAAATARSRGLTFPYAHDASGAFREALQVDQDPDFYVIDRAGQLRFADVATPSVGTAVKTLLAESREDAAALNARLEADAAEADRAFRRSGEINQGVDLRDLPEVPFPQPPATEYAFDARGQELAWPEQEDEGRNRGFNNQPVVRGLQLPDAGWAKMPPPPRNGRVTVAYFWHPDDRSSYEPLLKPMDRVQTSKGRDVVVVGILSPSNNRNRGFDNQGTSAEDVQRWAQTMRALAVNRRLAHHLLFDPTGAIKNAASGDQFGRNNNASQAAIASSDGIIRWSGRPGSPAFYAALDQILKIDPGVRARREAEQEFIKSRASQ